MPPPLSPIALKVLRLDYDGESSADIAFTTGMDKKGVGSVLSRYRIRYLLMRLGPRLRDTLGYDIVHAKMSYDDLIKKYNIPKHILTAAIIFYRRITAIPVIPHILLRCDKCNGKFYADSPCTCSEKR